MADQKPQNQVARLDQQLSEIKSVKELFGLTNVRERFIKNYESVTGRKDGENRLEQERFAYMELLNEKPELKGAPMFAHMSALVKAATTGLSFRDNKLYVQAVKRGDDVVGLKVTSSPAGKREQMEMMKEVKFAPEAQIVLKGDEFVYDKLNQKIVKHITSDKAPAIALENILYSYQSIIWSDGTRTDVVVPHDDLVSAKKKSKIKSADAGVWAEFPGEAAKKTATNRAFRLYHKYPDNVVLLDREEEDPIDTAHQEVDDYEQPAPSRTDVDHETGEDLSQPPPAEEPKVEKPRKKLTVD